MGVAIEHPCLAIVGCYMEGSLNCLQLLLTCLLQQQHLLKSLLRLLLILLQSLLHLLQSLLHLLLSHLKNLKSCSTMQGLGASYSRLT